MGFLKPKVVMPPPPTAPEPMPEAPDVSDEDVKAAAEEEARRLRKQKGRTSTILTGMMGDDSEATLNRKSLLG
tara:strand:+ start:1228 stop:1446 length:219 start_codon:yes stop_codon:yes gene_type:complete